MICLPLLFVALLADHQAALDLYKKRSYPEAAAAFEQALAVEKPGSPEYRESTVLLAQSLFLTGKIAEAIPWLEKAPPSSEVLYMLGRACLQLHAVPKAEAAFARMYGLDPKSAAAHLITAQMMMRHDDEDDAAGELAQALALDPKLPQVNYLLGELSLFHANPDEAVTRFQRELALNPDSSLAWSKLGDAYSRRAEWPLAVAALQKSIWLNPDFSAPYILLGKAYFKLEQFSNAEGVLRHAVAIDTRNYSAHYLLGQTLIQEGQTEEGRRMLELSQQLPH